MLASSVLVFTAAASAGALQQATVTQDAASTSAQAASQDPAPKPPAVNRGISAQAANEAAASQLEPASQDDSQLAQDDAQQASSKQALEAHVVDAKAVDLPVAPSSVTTAVAPTPAGATRGVLFRIIAPAATQLPAETAQVVTTDSPAQAPAPPAATAAAPPSSYLLATIHFGTPDEQGVEYAVLERAMADVETFVNEADLDEPWKAAYDDYRWLSPSQPLSKMVSTDSYSMARSLLPNVRPQDLVRMKPWAVLALLEARGEVGGETTMDARLQRIAAASGKRMVHLESLEQQLRALDCVPATEHALVLDERLRAPWILRDESAAAMDYYRTRNLDAWLADIDHMYGLSYAGKAIEQRSRQCLLEDRNALWVGQLETLFQDGPCFVAVGAVHLVGPDGLLAALRRDGYRIEMVPL